MGERLLTAEDVAERLQVSRSAAYALIGRLATAPSGRLPEARRAQRRVARVQPPAEPVDELAAERARRALQRRGLRP